MSRRKKSDATQEIQQVAEPVARAKFVPRACCMCTELRSDKTANYSKVYHTSGRARYCKCGFCGHTWKQVENI